MHTSCIHPCVFVRKCMTTCTTWGLTVSTPHFSTDHVWISAFENVQRNHDPTRKHNQEIDPSCSIALLQMHFGQAAYLCLCLCAFMCPIVFEPLKVIYCRAIALLLVYQLHPRYRHMRRWWLKRQQENSTLLGPGCEKRLSRQAHSDAQRARERRSMPAVRSGRKGSPCDRWCVKLPNEACKSRERLWERKRKTEPEAGGWMSRPVDMRVSVRRKFRYQPLRAEQRKERNKYICLYVR